MSTTPTPLPQSVPPDLSGLTQPAPAAAAMPAPNQAAPPPEAMTPGMAPPDVTDRSINPATPPPPPPGAGAGGHQRLLAMVQGLSIGLSAAATSIATHGAEGGAKEVIQIQQGQAAARREQQAFQTAQKSAELQQGLTTADTTRVNAQNNLLLSTFHDQQQKSHFETQEAGLNVTGKTQDIRTKALQDFQMTGDLGAYQDTLKKIGQVSGSSGPGAVATPGAPNAAPGAQNGIPPVAVSQWKNSIDTATGSYKNDPDIQAAQKQFEDARALKDPQAAALGMAAAARIASNRKSALDAATESQTKQMGLQKDELEQSQARLANNAWLRSVPKDTQGNPTQDFKTWQQGQAKALEQSITQGDPEVGGKMLADGTATLAELKARGSTPELIEKEIQAAQKYDPKYNASDEIVGEQVLKNTANQTFFGSARSLVQSGGMLDQLKAAHDRLGNAKLPDYNKYADWLSYKAGTPELAAYRAAVLGAADDYAKVVGGGNPTDSARQASADQFIYELNNGQFDSSVETSRGAVRSQVEGRIGTNRYVAQREGDILARVNETPAAATHPAPPASPAAKIHANMGDFKQQYAGKNGSIFSDDGKTWYDTHGQLVK